VPFSRDLRPDQTPKTGSPVPGSVRNSVAALGPRRSAKREVLGQQAPRPPGARALIRELPGERLRVAGEQERLDRQRRRQLVSAMLVERARVHGDDRVGSRHSNKPNSSVQGVSLIPHARDQGSRKGVPEIRLIQIKDIVDADERGHHSPGFTDEIRPYSKDAG
jgi:hypothetical protein